MELTKENLKILLSKSSSLGDDVLRFNNHDSIGAQGVDSLDALDYFLKIEEEFGVNIPDEDIERANSIDKLYDYLKARR